MLKNKNETRSGELRKIYKKIRKNQPSQNLMTLHIFYRLASLFTCCIKPWYRRKGSIKWIWEIKLAVIYYFRPDCLKLSVKYILQCIRALQYTLKTWSFCILIALNFEGKIQSAKINQWFHKYCIRGSPPTGLHFGHKRNYITGLLFKQARYRIVICVLYLSRIFTKNHVKN